MTLSGRKVTHKKSLVKAFFLSYKQNHGGGVCNCPFALPRYHMGKKRARKGIHD